METMYVNEKTLVGEVVSAYPEAAEVLFGIGMHCLGCPASRGETLEQACMVHGVDTDTFLDELNTFIASEA